MAYFSNPVVTVNSVSLTDQCTAATLTRRFDELDATVFGMTSRSIQGGLENNELSLTLFMDYAAGETYATLAPLVGTQTTVRVQPSSGADSATNPGFILTGALLAELPVLSATLGELSQVDVRFIGGTYSVDTTP